MNNKEKTVIVIGNGFDLDLGRGTSYKKFLDSIYIKGVVHTPLLDKIISKSKSEWFDLELELRNAILEWKSSGEKESFAIEINHTWQILNRKLFEYFFYEVDNNISKNIKTASCANTLLQKLQGKYCIYTFNYFNPYDGDMDNSILKFVHGEYIHDEFTSYHPMIMSQWNDMGFGIDCVKMESIVVDNKWLKPLIKKPLVNLQDILRTSNNIVIFGHSLGITDSDYFRPVFDDIIGAKSPVKHIVIITYNKKSEDAIKVTTKSWGVDLEIINQYVPVKYIHTEKGAQNDDFQTFLDTL